jgi:hypothetical protein
MLQIEAWQRRSGRTLAFLGRRLLDIVHGSDDSRSDRDLLGAEGLLGECFVLSQCFLNIMVQVKFDTGLGLLHLHTEKSFHDAATSDIEISDVFFHELFAFCFGGGYVHHIINEKVVKNEIRSLTFHKDSHFAVKLRTSVAFHPS